MSSTTDKQLVEIQQGKRLCAGGDTDSKEAAHNRYLINILKLASSFLLGSKGLDF